MPLNWGQFEGRERSAFLERPEVLRAIDEALKAKGWGSMDEGGKVTALKQEPQEMLGDSAKEFSEHSEGMSKSKYFYIVKIVEQKLRRQGVKQPLIADLGCGPGVLTRELAEEIKDAKAVGIDLSTDMLSWAKAGAEKAALNDRVKFLQMDAADAAGYFEQTEGRKPDMVVSRNMIHRVPDIEKMLEAFIQTAKDDGGMVYSVSFVSPENFDLRGLNMFLKGIRDRQPWPDLQESWTLAYLNAPTLERYQSAVNALNQKFKLKSVTVVQDNLNYLNIMIEKATQTT